MFSLEELKIVSTKMASDPPPEQSFIQIMHFGNTGTPPPQKKKQNNCSLSLSLSLFCASNTKAADHQGHGQHMCSLFVFCTLCSLKATTGEADVRKERRETRDRTWIENLYVLSC